MKRKEIVINMINELNEELKKENTPEQEKNITVDILRKYRKDGVSKFEVVDALNDIKYKYHSTFIALWNITLE